MDKPTVKTVYLPYTAEIIETGIDYETFIREYMGQSAEWYKGIVYKM